MKVRTGKRKTHTGHISHRIDEQHWRVRLLGAADGVTELASTAQLYRAEGEAPAPEEKKPANRQRRGGATGQQKASRSRYAIDPKAIASGKLPATAPVVTSGANPHYQKHFDRLFAHAQAGEWDAVREYKIGGSNSYSKMAARYRQDLLALHAAHAAPDGQASDAIVDVDSETSISWASASPTPRPLGFARRPPACLR